MQTLSTRFVEGGIQVKENASLDRTPNRSSHLNAQGAVYSGHASWHLITTKVRGTVDEYGTNTRTSGFPSNSGLEIVRLKIPISEIWLKVINQINGKGSKYPG